jgi:hypothetical protein
VRDIVLHDILTYLDRDAYNEETEEEKFSDEDSDEKAEIDDGTTNANEYCFLRTI